jgi:hypothetical protein
LTRRRGKIPQRSAVFSLDRGCVALRKARNIVARIKGGRRAMLDIAARNVGRDFCESVASFSRFGFVAAAAGLLLAACSGSGGGTSQVMPAKVPVAVTTTAPVLKHPSLEVAQLATLKTLSTEALIARLGEPDFTRHDPPAEIWQYRGTSCVLDVFLYPEDGEMKVLHAATRDRDRVQAPENNCTPFGPTRSASAGS